MELVGERKFYFLVCKCYRKSLKHYDFALDATFLYFYLLITGVYAVDKGLDYLKDLSNCGTEILSFFNSPGTVNLSIFKF